MAVIKSSHESRWECRRAFNCINTNLARVNPPRGITQVKHHITNCSIITTITLIMSLPCMLINTWFVFVNDKISAVSKITHKHTLCSTRIAWGSSFPTWLVLSHSAVQKWRHFFFISTTFSFFFFLFFFHWWIQTETVKMTFYHIT